MVYQPGKEAQGHYFYESPYDSDYGHIYGVKGLTLSKVLVILKMKGIDAINDYKLNIASYYPL